MKVTFYSNFLNHHQLPICLEFMKNTNIDFKFIATEKIPANRVKLGYDDMNNKYDFVIRTYEDSAQYDQAIKLALDSDIVIFGSAPYELLKQRIEDDSKITFRYSERLFKQGRIYALKSRLWLKSIFKKTTYNNFFLLCASAYAAKDYNICGQFIGKSYKWGYFPVSNINNINEIINKKELKIIWVGRLIEFKKPLEVIFLAKYLKKNHFQVKIDVIGTGPLEIKLKKMIKKNELSDYIDLRGSLPNKKVIDEMKNASIFIFTSGVGEGWGAVLNEAMNCGCGVVANYRIGAVPYLITSGVNGYSYRNRKQFHRYVGYLINNPNECKRIGTKAYDTIHTTWNAEKAVENFILLVNSISKQEHILLDGPCSIDDGLL